MAKELHSGFIHIFIVTDLVVYNHHKPFQEGESVIDTKGFIAISVNGWLNFQASQAIIFPLPKKADVVSQPVKL